MKLGLTQNARMEQRLVQSPQMIQAMQILQLSTLDLEGRVEQELMENPFLEVAEIEPERGELEAPNPDENPAEPGYEGMIEVLETYERELGDGRRTPKPDQEGADRKFEAMQNAPARSQSLGDTLVENLAFMNLSDIDRELAEYLIFSLDERGFLTDDLEDLANGYYKRAVTAADLGDVLDKLRAAAHPALGARDLRECLLLQLEDHPFWDPLVHELVEHHLEDITTNRLPRITRATGRSIEEIKHALELIRGLDPYPCHGQSETTAAVIHPDIVVEEQDGEFLIGLPRQRVPDLMVSPNYKSLLRQAREAGDDQAVLAWVKKKLESARWFINAVHQRQSTMQRIAEAIFARQRGFLEKGVSGLVPMRMQEIADEAHVHISTVSRAASGKYAQTPRGIFPLKFFFTSGTVNAEGQAESQTSIKDKLKRIVDGEDKQKPFSDDHLAALLEEQEGVKIARRTVTKYRRALDIPSSTRRREF
ncbi:MAG: RNA polymerase factor sigma-54 [Planctomycetota bacterium]|nr:RNA polymerase factor sigma-54 [Planctomycetota bacterium]